MTRLHELTPAQLEEWRKARMERGREKYGDAHMGRYGLVDVVEELLDVLNIMDLTVDRAYAHRHLGAGKSLRELRRRVEDLVWDIQEADHSFPDYLCTDEQGGRRIWWGEHVAKE